MCISKEGDKGIKRGRHGRRVGEKRTLTTEHEAQVTRALTGRTPDQMKLSFALWTRNAVKWLIKQQFGIEMPIRTAGAYLKRWGLTPRACEQNSEAVKKWLTFLWTCFIA